MTDEPELRNPWVHRSRLLVAFVVLASLFTGYWLDDAFIILRYARHLGEGLGPVFNPGEAVEGYTSFLWMGATAAPLALLPESAALRAVGLLGFALGVFTAWRALHFPAPDGGARLRPFAAVAVLSPLFVVNAADGMETALFTALLLESARALVLPANARSGAIAGALCAACALTRPEALPLLVVWPAWVLLLRGAGRDRWLAGFAPTALAPVGVHLAWRLSFYGQPFPNTFYAKATGALALRIEEGLAHGADLLVGGAVGWPPLWLWIGLGCALAGLCAARRGDADTRVWLAALWTPVLFRAGFDVWSGGETMGTFRFLAPALPPLFVLADEAARGLRTRSLPAYRALWLAAAATALVATVQLAQAKRPYREGLERAHFALGAWLRDTYPPETTLAIGDAGAVPFFSRLPVVDLWGLNDATIARLPGEFGDKPGTADYALGREPRVVVLWNLRPIRDGRVLRVVGAWPFDREVAEHPAFARHYRFVREWVFREAEGGRPNGYYLDVFERRTGSGQGS